MTTVRCTRDSHGAGVAAIGERLLSRPVINGHSRWLLSGGIGSGKTAVRELLEDEGWLAIDSDSVGHEVLQPGGAAFRDVVRRWPTVLRNGVIDRSALGAIVFRDHAALRALEELTHPHIFGTIQGLIQGYDGSVVVELPLMKSLGDGWARMIADCDDETRLDRLIERGMQRDEAEARMRSQPTREEWLAIADLVIPNTGSLEELKITVRRVLG